MKIMIFTEPLFALQQSSPYRDENSGYSPKPGSPMPPMMTPSPTSSVDFTSHMTQQALNRSCDSSASSSSFEPSQSPLPAITVSRAQETNNNNGNGANCSIENKVIAEHFNLDDLSASFRSLYKSVFQNSVGSGGVSNGSQNSARKDVMLNGKFL